MSYPEAHQDDVDAAAAEDEECLILFGKPLQDPILGKHFELPGRTAVEQRIDLDITASYTPVYTHLKIHEAMNLERPSTPPTIRRLARESYMDFYKANHTDNERVKCESLKEASPLKSARKSSVKGSIFFNSEDKQK